MRTVILIFLFTFSCFKTIAQELVIKYDVDTVIFNKKVGDSYLSDSTSAKIVCIKFPVSYDKSLEGFRHESNKNIVLIDKGEFKNGKKRISYKKGKLLEGKDEFMVKVYLIELNDISSLIISGIYPSKYEELLGDKIEIAAKSVKIE
ncbi:MAG: hypothetical protein CFE21_09265 [Bacteroidetes bacterium B1(2017)]|nr:MAG: hypothetical protein CFE21_09265 [Bacteroidetes bacterium B1(2017)]